MDATDRAEVRTTRRLELRAAESGDGYTLTGYASTFGDPYQVADFMGEYTETIRSGAFTRTLNAGADVKLLVNHDGVPLARTKAGTLNLEQDDVGLRVAAHLDPSSPLVQSVKSAMDRKDMDEMSFSFRATRQEWSKDYTQRDVIEAQLFDVSVVSYPANPATSASLRSATVARYGIDVWARIEASLRSGDPLDDEAGEVLQAALRAAGVVPDTITPEVDETPAEPASRDAGNALAALRLRAAALDLAH